MIDTQLLHQRIADRAPAFVAELFGDEAKRAGEGKWRVGRRGSLAIGQREGRLVFFSHEDGGKGDAVALWQRQRGGTAGEALQACAAWAGVSAGAESSPPKARRPRKARVQPPPMEPVRFLTPEEIREATECAILLHESPELIAKIVASRADCGWKPEIIAQLLLEGVIGWSSGWMKTDPETGRTYPVHRGAITFHYESGLKHRWRKRSDPPGKKRVAWKCGNGRTLWRSEQLRRPDVRTVWICEGEPDVITMLSTGWESEPGEAVVGLSSATGIPPDIAGLLGRRDVVIVPDQDEPGSRAAEKLITLIGATARSIKIWKL